jgi:hypothetical protein
MSAYAQLNGHYDFNRAPMAPHGTRVITHEKPDQRASWDPHGVDGYYIVPALDDYRCYQVYITKTCGTRVVDTVEFFPFKTAMPQTSSKDIASIAAYALLHPAPAAPFNDIGTSHLQALHQLLDIFTTALPPTAIQNSPPLSQAVSQFINTIPPAPVPMFTSPGMVTPQQPPPCLATTLQFPPISRYATPRVRPSQVPSPRVTPRVSPRQAAPPRVDPMSPQNTIISLTPHPVPPDPLMYPNAWRVKISSTPLRKNTWRLLPCRGTTLGPGHNINPHTALNVMQHAFSSLSCSPPLLGVILTLNMPVTKYLWTMLLSTRTLVPVWNTVN